MSPRRPGHDEDEGSNTSFEDAAAAAGIRDDFDTLFDGPKVVKVNEDKKPLLGRRLTLTIERTGPFDNELLPDVRKALLAYLYACEVGNGGHAATEIMHVDEHINLQIEHTAYALDVVEPKP